MLPHVQHLFTIGGMARSARKKRQMKPRKVIDDLHTVRSQSGQRGKIREEVWVDEQGQVVKYNLAYINFTLYAADNARILGYDNAHGYHERHFKGSAEKVEFS